MRASRLVELILLIILAWGWMGAAAFAQASLPARVVRNDMGGMVRADYLPRIAASIRARQRVVIDEKCESACTLELRNPYACLTSRAELYYHNSPALPHVAVLPESHWLFRLHPPHVQALIRARGGLTHTGFTVSGTDLAAFAPLCGD